MVSSPTFWASIWKEPILLTDAAMTLSPTFFSTGILSPVNADWSTEELPSMMTPSTGMLCPGLITMRSPTTTSSTGISCSSPLRMTVAVFGAKCNNFVIASEVLPLDFVSKNLPRVIKANIIAEDSKYKSIV